MKYIQAPDASWNKPFKLLVSEQHDDWMANGLHHYIEAGNMYPLSRKMIVEWVLEGWSQLAQDVVVKSFKLCTLNLAVDSSKDSIIHCFKKGQVCKSGLDQLKARLSVLDIIDSMGLALWKWRMRKFIMRYETGFLKYCILYFNFCMVHIIIGEFIATCYIF